MLCAFTTAARPVEAAISTASTSGPKSETQMANLASINVRAACPGIAAISRSLASIAKVAALETLVDAITVSAASHFIAAIVLAGIAQVVQFQANFAGAFASVIKHTAASVATLTVVFAFLELLLAVQALINSVSVRLTGKTCATDTRVGAWHELLIAANARIAAQMDTTTLFFSARKSASNSQDSGQNRQLHGER